VTQLKTVTGPYAPPAKPESDELTPPAKRRCRDRGWTRARTAPRMVLSAKATGNGCLPKPSNRDRSPSFREVDTLNAQQHIARS
jgi:hypothetical protein